MRSCAHPGCPNLTDRTYCQPHKRQRTKPRPSGTRRGYGQRWQQFAKRYLRTHPLCEHCGKPATDVDHIDGQGPKGPDGYDDRNLRALCHSCHSKRTARDQPAGAILRRT